MVDAAGFETSQPIYQNARYHLLEDLLLSASCDTAWGLGKGTNLPVPYPRNITV